MKTLREKIGQAAVNTEEKAKFATEWKFPSKNYYMGMSYAFNRVIEWLDEEESFEQDANGMNDGLY